MKSIMYFFIMLFISLSVSLWIFYDPKAVEVVYTLDDVPSCYWVIRPNDSFWKIASSIKSPEDNIQDVVYSIQLLNPHLNAGTLQAGDPVLLPGKDCF